MNLRTKLASACLALIAMTAWPAGASQIDSIVYFGDSLSDTGNVWLATGGFPPPPYNQGSSGGPPDFTGGQWSDPAGPSWPSVFAAFFGLTATPSLVPGGNNFAWGGARTGVNPDPTGVPWLDQQVGQYQMAGATPSPATLFSIMIGGNDVANTLGDVAALDAGITSVVTQVTNLWGLGGREFLIATVPDIGATPRLQELDQASPGVAALATSWSIAWNEALVSALGQLMLPDAHIAFVDLFGALQDPEFLSNFDNTTDACLTVDSICTEPGAYLYWDSFHPTSTAHRLIAERALQAVGVPEPATLALLAVALLGLGAANRRAG